MTLCLVMAAVFYLLGYSGMMPLSNAYKESAMLLILVPLLIFSIQHKVKKVTIRRLAATIYFFFITTILFAGMLHTLRSGYIVFAIILIIMPGFYIVWADRGDINSLFDKIASVWSVIGFVFYVICFVCMPPDNVHFYLGRYSGLTINPNIMGMVTVSVLAAALYLIMLGRLNSLAIVDTGISLAMMWLSGSRTAFLADLCMIAAFIIIAIKGKDPLQRGSKSIMAALALSLVIGAFVFYTAEIPAEQMGYKGIDMIREITDSSQKFTEKELRELEDQGIAIPTGEITEPTHIASIQLQPVCAQVYASAEADIAEEKGESERTGLGHDGATLSERMTGYDDIYGVFNGRLEIYSQILEQINLTGHVHREPFTLQNGEKQDYAHNTPIDFTYICGVPSGLSSLMIYIITAIYVLTSIFGRKQLDPGRTYALLIMIGFGIESMLEIQLIFGSRGLVMLFYIVFAEIFAERRLPKHDVE